MNDGDKSLVVADPLLISIAERNMMGITPMYYKMGKAGAVHIDKGSCYNGMIQAYRGGKIGQISNDITKIWNSEDVDYKAIQRLCARGNYAIDAAKTLYEPEFPSEVGEKIQRLTSGKTPHFFIYAKGKTKEQVEVINNSVVNRLEGIIPNARLRDRDSSVYKFDYRDLMNDASVIETDEVVAVYNDLYRKYKHSFSITNDTTPYSYIRNEAAIEITKAAGSLTVACDMLIHYLFKTRNSSRQKVFWLCFADIVLENLDRNLAGTFYCVNCGARVKRDANNQKLCFKCAGYQKIGSKTNVCCDCGVEFVVDARNTTKTKCDECYKRHRTVYYRENKRKKRKMSTVVLESQSQSNP